MHTTVKLAVIGASLLMAAHAGAVDRRKPNNALDVQDRGPRLRLALEREYQDLRRTGGFKSAGNDVSAIVKKYIPVGTSFDNAETTLRSSGFEVAPPREPPKSATPQAGSEPQSETKAPIFGTLVLAQRGVSRILVEATLFPKITGADHATVVKGVRAAIQYRGL